DEGVGATWSLDRADAFGVDRRAVLDAALLGPNSRHVRAGVAEDFVALAGLRLDDGNNVDHFSLSPDREAAGLGSIVTAFPQAPHRALQGGRRAPRLETVAGAAKAPAPENYGSSSG